MILDVIRNKLAPGKFHVCETTFDKSLPCWRKMPVCKNGGLDLNNWKKVEIESTDLLRGTTTIASFYSHKGLVFTLRGENDPVCASSPPLMLSALSTSSHLLLLFQ